MATQNNNLQQQAAELIQTAKQKCADPNSLLNLLKQLLALSKQLYHEGELDYSRRLLKSASQAVRDKDNVRLLQDCVSLEESQILDLAKQLKGLNEHALARELLTKFAEYVGKDKLSHKVAQQLALNTYKDNELPPDSRFSKAREILDGIGLRDPKCDNPETLGLGGAIYKRKFEYTGQIEDLKTAYYFYSAGWERNPQADMGYCGINAAYMLDLLAHRARMAFAREKIPENESAGWNDQARELRKAILEQLPQYAAAKKKKDPHDKVSTEWWYLVTMAEAAFGLQDWHEAQKWLTLAKNAEHFEWERETTTKQLVAFARIQGFVPPQQQEEQSRWDKPWQTLAVLLGDDALAAFECFRGKVGLALSGGGFRAAFYHLGVLARLAEVDALRSVEVLSTVSGGSIVGAHYYLALRKLLQREVDAKIKRQGYIDLVKTVSEQFFSGTAANLRVRALASLQDNFRMLFEDGYGRSNRIGELYENFLFNQADQYPPPTDINVSVHSPSPKGSDSEALMMENQALSTASGQEQGEGSERLHINKTSAAMRPMNDLFIRPCMATPNDKPPTPDDDFHPKYSNWRRRNKVPTLLLNTTSLNSGHNWHFTASWMGEPPGLMGQEVDMNERYRRLYYDEAPTLALKNYPLGYAVAASAGVPALFDPIELKDLYPGRTIRLVDGGVHDNQGIAGLLAEGCSLILCSDASGQMNDQDSPASSALGVFYRSDSILQDRVREAQCQDLAARAESHALQGVFFVHLKQELETDPINWIGCANPVPPAGRNNQTSYGIDRTLQLRLSEIRTDLDVFTEAEAYALMASGYLMAKHQLEELNQRERELGFVNSSWGDFDIDAPQENWVFTPMISILAADPNGSDRRATDLEKQLRAGRLLFGKAWVLVPALKYGGLAFIAAFIGLIGYLLCIFWQATLSLNWELGIASIATAGVLALLGLALPLAKYFQPLDTAKKWLILSGLATFGWIAANVHLKFIDPLFLKRGKLDRLLALKDKQQG